MPRTPPTAARTTVRAGTTLSFTVAGTGPTVVLLHGLAGSSREFEPTMAGLMPGYRVAALDQRGHGRSTRRPADVSREAYVLDVVALIELLSPGEPVHLVGQSMGAHTAMLTAADRPDLVASLVLLECDAGPGERDQVAGLGRYFASWPVPFKDAQDARTFLGDSALASAWLADLEQRPDGLWPRFDPDIMAACMVPVTAPRWHEWQSVAAPTLVLYGEHGMFTERQKAEFITARPGTRRVDIPGAGHDAHLENFPAWIRALREFLECAQHPSRVGAVELPPLAAGTADP
ncbi:alpha/beta fold hydrolase [Arthrobacter sp. ERGS1:01]|uniref:alpha/beta fold hydrolase n=1 Tax=Arthrobacter sp. ERGS1:01 TaxID=1704044 RepID=UPI0009E79ECC|nr:alpha/beta hydrolase [Arthrobacter sp. ERGS1:01]